LISGEGRISRTKTEADDTDYEKGWGGARKEVRGSTSSATHTVMEENVKDSRCAEDGPSNARRRGRVEEADMIRRHRREKRAVKWSSVKKPSNKKTYFSESGGVRVGVPL